MELGEIGFKALPSSLVVIVIALTILSGLAAYLDGVRVKRFKPSLIAFVDEIASSMVGGIAVMFLGAWQEFPPSLTCLMALAAANNGKEYMRVISEMLKHKITGSK